MPIDSRAKEFIEANIVHYREVTVAVAGFEAEVESVLRSIWKEFKEQLAAVGVPEDSASFKAHQFGNVTSNMNLKGQATNIQIGIILQCRNADDKRGRFCVFSWVWVKDPDLRRSLDRHVATRASAPFVYEFEQSTTYLSAYLDLAAMPKAIDLLRDSFEMLFECLFGSPEFCKAYNISGPASEGDAPV